MKLKYKRYILVTGFVLLQLCTSYTTFSQEPLWMPKVQWLLGTWEGQSGEGPFNEVWLKKSDSILINLGIEVKGKDTIVAVLGELKEVDGQLTYGGLKIKWKAGRVVNNELVLSNDTLTSPRTIIWFHTPGDRWWTILQYKDSSINYDILRNTRFQPYVDRMKQKWLGTRKG